MENSNKKTPITKGDWFRSGTEIVAMPSQVKITNRISGATYEEATANAIAVSKVPEMIDLLQSLKILQEEKMLCHDMRITQDTMTKVDSLLKELK